MLYSLKFHFFNLWSPSYKCASQQFTYNASMLYSLTFHSYREAMKSIDPATGHPRGFYLIGNSPQCPTLYPFSLAQPSGMYMVVLCVLFPFLLCDKIETSSRFLSYWKFSSVPYIAPVLSCAAIWCACGGGRGSHYIYWVCIGVCIWCVACVISLLAVW